MKARYLFFVCVFCMACTPCFPRQGPEKSVSVDGDMLSVDIKMMPLFDVLKEIAAETGMEVTVDPEINKTVTATFENIPIDRGIARLIHPLDYVIKWRRITDGEESVDEITAVEIFRKGERDKAQQVLSPRRPPRGPQNLEREKRRHRGKETELQPPSRRSRRSRSTTRYRSRIIVPEESESGGSGTSPRESSSGHVRIRKFEAISDTDAYDELSP